MELIYEKGVRGGGFSVQVYYSNRWSDYIVFTVSQGKRNAIFTTNDKKLAISKAEELF